MLYNLNKRGDEKMYYLMLTVSAMLLGADFALNKIYQRIYGTAPKTVFLFNSLLGLITTGIFFAVNGFHLNFSLYSFIMAGLMSLLVMCYNMIGFRLLKSGTMAMYTLFLMTGGMVLPYIWGLLFLNEPFSVLRTAALMIILSGVVLSNFSGERANLKQIGMCAAVFILNGCVSIISKMHQSQTIYESVNAVEFIILGGIFKFLLAGILFLVLKNKDNSESVSISLKKAVIIIASSSMIGGVSYMLQLLGAKSLPATVLYPFITGGSIVFAALAGVIVFKEKLSARLIISVILCFAGTLMFL